ncbi:hypothetical protein KQH40_01260 [bacterium]|nr:hypothetical protein [bacterium]
MTDPNETEPGNKETFTDTEIGRDSEPDESLINWKLIGTIFLSTILIISIIFGMIGPAIIQSDFKITLPASTPTPNPFLIGFEF